MDKNENQDEANQDLSDEKQNRCNIDSASVDVNKLATDCTEEIVNMASVTSTATLNNSLMSSTECSNDLSIPQKNVNNSSADNESTDDQSGESTEPKNNSDRISTEIKNSKGTSEEAKFEFAVPPALENISKNEPSTTESEESKKQEIPYKEPPWGGTPDDDKHYFLTILKEGVIKGNVQLANKSVITFGRMSDCDVSVEHPSCSRYHAVIQYCVLEKDIRKKGYYIFDLGSTHGTYVNKEKLKPKVFTRIRVGYQIKFGGSTRTYIVEGPDDDKEDEVDLDILRKKKQMYLQQQQVNKQKQSIKLATQVSDATTTETKVNDITWGFGEDAVEEHINLQELFEKKKSIEVKDPKKTLRTFFENEGIDFEYEMSERGTSYNVIHVAKVRLPIETSTSHEVVAEGTGSSKKDAVLICATEACRLLQAYDAMQSKCTEDQRLKRQRELEENDFYDSDEDNFLDRTGSLEAKRLRRKKRAGKKEPQQQILTHEKLKEDLEIKQKELVKLESKLELAKQAEIMEDSDNLDDYMNIVKHKLDKSSKLKLRKEIADLKKDIEKILRLVTKTKPALPTVQPVLPTTHSDSPAVEFMEKADAEESHSMREKTITKLHETKQWEEKKDSSSNRDSSSKVKSTNYKPINEVINKGDNELNSPTPKKKKTIYGVQNNKLKPSKDEEEVSAWMPPPDQTGDGRTHLNEKFGY